MVFQSRHLALAVGVLTLLVQPVLAHARSAKAHHAVARHRAAYTYKYRSYKVRHSFYAMAESPSADDPFDMQVRVPNAPGQTPTQICPQQSNGGAWQPQSVRLRHSQAVWRRQMAQSQAWQPASFTPSWSAAQFPPQRSALDGMVEQQASANGIPSSLVRRVIMRESGYNPRAAHAGNYGLMQIRLGTARAMGYTGSAAGLLDPATNMTYAVRYLAGAYRAAGGNENRAVALYARGYNASRAATATYY